MAHTCPSSSDQRPENTIQGLLVLVGRVSMEPVCALIPTIDAICAGSLPHCDARRLVAWEGSWVDAACSSVQYVVGGRRRSRARWITLEGGNCKCTVLDAS